MSGDVPLKVRGTRLGDLQQLSSTEENYLAYLAGLHMSEDSGAGSLSLSAIGNDLIGSFVDTFFNEPIGTHPASLITTSTVATNLYQIDGGGVSFADSDHRIPVGYAEVGGQNTFVEMSGSTLNTFIDRLNSRIATSDYPGVFKLGSSSPGVDYSVYLPGVFQDTQTDGTTVTYNLYRRTSMAAPSSVNMMSIKRSGGKTGTFQGLQEMTTRQMKVSLGQYVKDRLRGAGNIGTYQLRSSTQGAPTAPGTWKAMGTATDTKKQTANQDFAREIDVNYTNQYSLDFTGEYTTDYVNTYTGDYATDYSFDFTGNYSREYIRENVEETYLLTFTGDYVRDFFGDSIAQYTGDYTNEFAKDYSTNYTRTYTGNYTNVYTGEFAVDFVGDYVRDFSREVAENYTREIDAIGSQQNIEENYISQTFVLGPIDTSRTATFSGDYIRDVNVNSTRTDQTFVRRTREGSTYTKTINSTGTADFVGNYAFEARNYAGGGGTTIDGPKITFSPASYLAVGSSTNVLYWNGVLLRSGGLGVVPTDGVYRNYVVGGVTYTVAAFSSPSFSIVPGTTYFAVARRVAAADVNYTKDAATYSGNYVGPAVYSRDVNYTQTFTGDFVGDYTGDYIRTVQENFVRDRASTFVSSVTVDYTGDFVGNYTRDFVRTFVGDNVGIYINEDATQLNIQETYTRDYVRDRQVNYARDINQDFVGDYGIDYVTDFLSLSQVNYTSFSNLNITEDYSRDFIGNYTGDFAVEELEVYTGEFTKEYTRERDSVYTKDYSTDYARDYLTDYTTRYTGEFSGLTIQSSSTTIQTYTLYVRTA